MPTLDAARDGVTPERFAQGLTFEQYLDDITLTTIRRPTC